MYGMLPSARAINKLFVVRKYAIHVLEGPL